MARLGQVLIALPITLFILALVPNTNIAGLSLIQQHTNEMNGVLTEVSNPTPLNITFGSLGKVEIPGSKTLSQIIFIFLIPYEILAGIGVYILASLGLVGIFPMPIQGFLTTMLVIVMILIVANRIWNP